MDKKTTQYYAEHAEKLCLTYNQVEQGVSRYFERAFVRGDKVLDIGCGSGRDLARLHSLGMLGYGVDPSSQMLEQAEHTYSFLEGCIQEDELPSLSKIEDDLYDGVLCSAVLMHLPEEHLFDAVYAIRRVLKEGGSLLISLPRDGNLLDSGNQRDEHGRFFSGVTPEQVQLVLERVGFQLLDRWDDADDLGRKNRTWHTLLLRLNNNQGGRSLDKIEAVLNRDKKVATYKPALFRALAEIAVTNYHLVVWLGEGEVSLPISSVSEKWVEYYWPIFESDIFIPQIQAEGRDVSKPIAFRKMMKGFINDFSQQGGLAGFISAYRNGRLTDASAQTYRQLLSKLNATIREGPVKHSGGIHSGETLFSYDTETKSIVMPADIWRELSMMGPWIQDVTVLRWAELTAKLSKETIRPSQVIDCLLKRPDPVRDVKSARDLYLSVDNLECVWTDQVVQGGSLAIDHAIPYSLWKNNELWNLQPSDSAVNNQKSDKLPTYDLIQCRKDALISNWERMHSRFRTRFEYEASHFSGSHTMFDYGNWQNHLFNRFCESVEVTAVQRGVERWTP